MIGRLFLNLIRQRGLAHALAVRDLRVRYKGSALGFLWTFINPALSALVYAVVFSTLFKTQVEHYGLYVFAGVILWTAVSQSLVAGSACMTANANLITRSALPPEIIPLRVVLVSFYNYTLTLPLFYAAALFEGHLVSISAAAVQLAWLIPILFLCIFSMALGLSVLGAVFRDTPHLVSSLVMIIFFTTPVMYRSSMLPDKVRAALEYSPFTQMILLHNAVIFDGRWLKFHELSGLLLTTAACLLVSSLLYRKYRNRIAESI